MLFQVTEIEFDFEMDDDEIVLSDEYKQGVVDEIISHTWEVDDEEYLVDSISDATGWCIKSIDYRHILS